MILRWVASAAILAKAFQKSQLLFTSGPIRQPVPGLIFFMSSDTETLGAQLNNLALKHSAKRFVSRGF
jgi:hypothetical protein